MAVHRDGLLEEDEDEENGVFREDYAVLAFDPAVPHHLQALAVASQGGDLGALHRALDELEGNINEPVEDGDTALHLACLYGHFSCVKALIDHGADLETKDEDGAIPLHDACAGGFAEIVQYLLEQANGRARVKRMLETADSEGDTPLHHAARGEHADVIRILLAAGASTTVRNLYGKTPSELPDLDTEAKTILDSI